MEKGIRFDFQFSNWLFVWFVVFCFFPHYCYNPFPSFIIAILFSVSQVILLSPKWELIRILLFVLMVTLGKGLPLLYLQFTGYGQVSVGDVAFGVFLFLLYHVWLHLNDLNFVEVIRAFKKAKGGFIVKSIMT